MKISRSTRHFLLSLGIICLLALVIFAFYYPSTTTLGKGFNLAILYMFAQYIAIIAGIVLIALRILFRKNTHFMYILTGTLNLVVGISCIVLFIMGEANLPWLHKCLLNLFVGFLIFADIFLIFSKAR